MNHKGAKDTKDEPRADRGAPPDRWSNRVIGAAIAVHQALGAGFLESVYEEALCIELQERGIPFVRQAPVIVRYKGHVVGEGRLDLLVGGTLVVELKTVESFAPIHVAQVLSYLQALGQPLGLLLNFKSAALGREGVKRVILT